jgi:hypothetical protein
MDLKDLKKTWSQIASTTEANDLSEEKIIGILQSRTTNLMEKLDKNIRIGIAVLLFLIALIIAWDFILILISNNHDDSIIPEWITLLDRFVNVFIFILFLVFTIRYHQIRRKCTGECNLRQSLEKIIEVLTTYKRLFVLALIIFMLAVSSSYLAGFYKGIHIQDQSGAHLPAAIIAGLITLMLFAGLLFILIRWIFRRVYGTYLNQLKETLTELDELSE